MKTKQLFITLTAVALCLSTILAVSCSKKDGTTHRSVESVKFNANAKSVGVDSTVTIAVTITPSDAEYTDIAVSSSNESIATASISKEEKLVRVKGVKAGEAFVIVTVDSFRDTCLITVVSFEPQKYTVKLNAQKDTVEVGKTIELTATVEPTEGANAVWKSGDEKVAKVTGDTLKGTVTGVAEGKTFIYCIVNEFFEDSCEVTVVPPTSSPANCYIVTATGSYSFKTVKGNSTESVGDVKSAEVLWETFGTDKAPKKGDIISSVKYDNGEISYTATDKKGNAVIAAKDGSGNILWSWHIWCTDQPSEQNYNNQAGTMMDRNLGATSATPGEVSALGLFYQWGRKDPFLGSSAKDAGTQAASTLEWPSAEAASSHLSGNNTLAYSISNPTTFITDDDLGDWYCTDATYQNDNLWKNTAGSAKTIYDPCPVGWRVPDGGTKSAGGVWAKAFNNDDKFEESVFANGFDFGTTDKKLVGDGSDQCWYPAAGYDWAYSLNNVGSNGEYWSCTPCSSDAYSLYFNRYDSKNYVTPSSDEGRAYGLSVRCLKEK